MDRKKLVAIITGAISITLAIGYLLLVQLLDFRGEMLPAPVSQMPLGVEILLGSGFPSSPSPFSH
ncbi:MAG: hypothetical protein ABI417_10530 [Coleofasciculaceae cyanobacterium]